jgi:hypothetical protein
LRIPESAPHPLNRSNPCRPDYRSSPHPAACFERVTRRKGFTSAASVGSNREWLSFGAPGTQAAPLRSREWFGLAAAGMAGGGHGGQGCSPAAAVAGPSEARCSGAVGSWSPWGFSGPAVAGGSISRLAAKERAGAHGRLQLQEKAITPQRPWPETPQSRSCASPG